jgi:micrococcal nuclease
MIQRGQFENQERGHVEFKIANGTRTEMKKFIIFIIFIILYILTFSGVVLAENAQTYTIKRVIEGDTLKLTNGETVRLIGIDCPERKSDVKAKMASRKTGKSVKIIKIMGRKAVKFVKNLVEGKKVRLEFDVEKRDREGRLLAYVWLKVPFDLIAQNPISPEYPAYWEVQHKQEFCLGCSHPHYIFLNATIIKAGHATPMPIPPNVKYSDLFEELYQEAKND